MDELRVVHRRSLSGWWVLEGPGWPPAARVVSTFVNLADAVAYVRDNQPSRGPGRPPQPLNDDIVLYALKAAGSGKVRKAAEILGVGYATLRRYLDGRVAQKAGL